MDDGIKSRLISWTDCCCHSEQRVLSSSMLEKNADVKTQTTLFLMLFALLKVELTLTHKRRHRVFVNGVLSMILGPKREEVLGGCTDQDEMGRECGTYGTEMHKGFGG